MTTGVRTRSNVLGFLERGQDLLLPLVLVASVLVIVAPLPAAVLDILLSLNIAVSILVLLTTIYVKTPLEFSVFPSLLLTTTLARLVLNISTTRQILTHASEEGINAAGGVVSAFGEFVAGNNIVVGIVIFIIILAIQFLVITKGATRISEVAARFTLDGMPGKQMAIDADLNAGIIDEREAQRRRQDIARQADFFGAMDGASKFVRGDAIAGIVIVAVNIIGGLAIGVLQNGMSLTQAFDIFTKLTIGDGLVSQIPAFLISLAAGLLVTRGSSESSLPRDFIQQVFYRPRALGISACFLALLIFTNLPKLPLAGLAASSGGLAWVLTKKQQAHDAAAIAEAQQKAARPVEQRIEDCMHVDPMEMEIGAGLIRLADHKRGGDLLDRIQRVRHNLAADLGVVMPKVRIRDNLQLPANAYRIKLHDVPVAEGAIQPEMWLALSPNGDTPDIAGQTTIDPAFGTPAKWILSAMRDKAQLAGCTVVEPTSVLATHLTEVVRRHADEILTRDAVKGLIDEVKKSSPSVVDELIPSQMKLSDVQQVLQNLLRESVPIRQLSLILETLGDYAGRTKDPILLTDYVRHRLSRTICSRLRDNQNQLHVIVLDPKWEERIRTGSEHNDRGLFIRMSPQHIEELCRNLVSNLRPLVMDGRQPVLLVNPQIRAAVRQITATRLPTLQILSYNEISRDTQVESRGVVQAA